MWIDEPEFRKHVDFMMEEVNEFLWCEARGYKSFFHIHPARVREPHKSEF